MIKYRVLLVLAVVLVTAGLSHAVSTTIVISEFKVKGDNADDEFIEIYNMTSSQFNLNGYRLVYSTASGTLYSIKSWTSDTFIPAYGHYLWANGSGIYSGVADATTTQSLSGTGGGIAIRQGAMETGTIIDSVGYGSATNDFVETTAKSPVHANGKSFERQRSGISITDTDNNNSDFQEVTPTPMSTSDASLPVVLSSFTATFTDFAIILKWVTESEEDNLGFYIYRSKSKNGPFKRISPLIKGAGTTASRHKYEFADDDVNVGDKY